MADPKRRAKRSPRPAVARATDPTRAQNVLLERLESQMTAVLEAVTSGFARLDAKIDDVEARLSARISVLEEVVRQNSADIRKNSEDIRKNSEDIERLRAEVARLRYDFDHRAELDRIATLEGRVTALEARLNG